MSQKKSKKLAEKQDKVIEQQLIEPVEEVQPKKKTATKDQGAKKIKNKSNRLQIKPEKDSGIVYIGKLPYGFVEEGIQEYFSQFGDILAVKLRRSKKTNRGQGFGFVKFEDKEVARIAAKTMDGYMMLGKQISAQLLDEKHPDPFKYKDGSKKLKFIKWQQVFKKEINKEKTDEQIVKEINQLLKNERIKRLKLEELGIDYQYNGFKETLDLRAKP